MKLSSLGSSVERAIAEIESNVIEAHYPAGVQQAIDVIARGNHAPQLVESIRRRVALIDRARIDREFQKQVIVQCAESPVTFINDWCWTQDPRKTPATMPFDLFPKQVEFIEWLCDRINEEEDGIVEKSRDMGLSWLCVTFGVHQWLFIPGSKLTFGSRKEMLVDRLGDPDSLFEKARILLSNLPKWMLPKDHSSGILKFVNRDNGNTITGESGSEMGRGGRSSLYFLDEFAFVERAQRVDAAVSQNSNVKIYVSTPNGPGNTFAKKRFSGGYKVFTFRWQDDPRKGPDWYANQVATLDPVIVAQEIDVNYSASIEGICIPHKWIMAAVDLRIPAFGDRVAGLDIADEGACKNVMIVRQGPVVNFIADWAEGNTTQTAYKARDIGDEKRIKHLNYDCIGVGAGVGGTLASCDRLTFSLNAINGGESPTDTTWAEFEGRSSKEMFRNRRAESWWIMRRRFEKTYEYVNNINQYPESELISIPNHPELIAQLGQPLRKFNDTGKIVIESKAEMSRRGVGSPDYADALSYCFAPVEYADNSWLGKA